jgi:hypothetical protein
MHLEGPWLSTTGKKKGKQKFASAEHKRKAEQADADWKELQKRWGSSYDIVVRPEGSRSVTEDLNLLEPNYMSGLDGGISRKQYETIKQIADVEVAAPIAMIAAVIASATSAPRMCIPFSVPFSGTPPKRIPWRYSFSCSFLEGIPFRIPFFGPPPPKKEFLFIFPLFLLFL